jgi:multimeric flavodoxin WrbA
MGVPTETNMGDRGRAVLLVGSREASVTVRRAAAALSRDLTSRGWEAEAVDLAAQRIASCNGCFECWVKTPGVCRIRDFGRELAARVIRSDLMVLVTRVRFGSYDAEVQGAMERLIPLISPFFRTVGGETHHALRYDHYPALGAMGIVNRDGGGGRIFRTRVARNAMNFFSPSHAAVLIPASASDGDVDGAVRQLIGALGVSG